MASWMVLERPSRANPAEPELAFLRDGFSWLAFLFPPLWLLWHRLWVEAVATFAVLLAGTALEEAGGLAAGATMVSLLVSIFIGLEGRGLRIAAFQRRGWQVWGVVEADSEDDAETRFAAEADEDADGIPDRYQMNPVASRAGAAPATPVGLLLNPGH
jgi:hypothetical protein